MAAVVLLGVVLTLVIGKRNEEIATVLRILICCMVAAVVMQNLKPVMDFAAQLQHIGQMDSEMIRSLWKVIGIAMISEIATMVCSDSGNTAMGKALQMLSGAVILYLSIPMMNAMLKLLQDILSNV